MTQVLTRIIRGAAIKPPRRIARRWGHALPGMMLACGAALALPACSDTTAPGIMEARRLPIQDLIAPDSVGPGAVIPVDFTVAASACSMFSRYTVEITPAGAAITAWGTPALEAFACTPQTVLIPLHVDVPTRYCGVTLITARQPPGADSVARVVKVTGTCGIAL